MFPIIYTYAVWFQFLYRINAAFGVSQKFVPYRPNYDLVANVAFSCGFVHESVPNGDLNAISASEFKLYNNPTNLPSGQSGYFFVQTIIFDKNSGYQEITALTQNGETYKRMLYGGTWRAWKQITMT